MESKLRIGKIPFLNLFPIFYELEGTVSPAELGSVTPGTVSPAGRACYEFIEGYPSALNKMLREGEIDISPSSSIEYLRDRDNYMFIDGHSISSKGRIESILLFSRIPLEELNGHEVFVTHQSETSPVLLNIILSKFYGIKVDLKTTDVPIKTAVSAHSAYLSIGDEAFLTSSMSHRLRLNIQSPDYELSTIEHQIFFIYDLGNLWFRHTGLPFVFALWTARKGLPEEKKELFERFKDDLNRAKQRAMEDMNNIAQASDMKNIIGADKLISYWKSISYDLGDEHKKGLELFMAYAEELGLL